MDIAGLIPIFGNVIWTLVAFVAALSVIVAIHEYGHYIVGRWSGIKAEVFSIGFGPVLASRVDKRGTKWQIAALPFGGFVKFLGDAGAASDKDTDVMEALDDSERRSTMHGAPLWARTATVAAGPVFNFILSFLIFGALLMFRGVAADPITVDELRTLPDTPAQTLAAGDVILEVEGQRVPATEEFGGFARDLTPQPSLTFLVERDGQVIEVPGPWLYPLYVSSVTPNWAADEAGLLEGDVITAVDGQPVFDFEQLRDAVGDSEGKPLTLDVWRDGEDLTFTMTPARRDLPLPDGGFETRWLIGLTGGLAFEPAATTPSLLEAAEYGVDQIQFIITSSISGLYHMVAGKISTCNLSGPIGIAETSGQAASQGWFSFVYFIALLSTAVGLINLFPIPVLDGGHLVFYAFEAVTGRPPSDRALKYLMACGLTLMLALMVFSVGNDLVCP
ncbi:MAG: RIP metalloprotease RseP [Paracoccaceae bacterium]|nr:RIP metalloprotease RseP [Paracoccaceae bacterium]